jgi:hypothetical protein
VYYCDVQLVVHVYNLFGRGLFLRMASVLNSSFGYIKQIMSLLFRNCDADLPSF